MDISYILPRKIQQLSHHITQRRNQDLRQMGLTAEQADTLLFFHTYPESAAADLKTYLGVTHQAARAIVERMVNKGLLDTHISSHDARYKMIMLTALGEELYANMQKNCINFGDLLLEHINAADQYKLLILIQQVLENMEHISAAK